MALTPGTRIGPYEVLSSLGAGGMGEVYRARDTRLNRDVAIKVLPVSLVQDASSASSSRRARPRRSVIPTSSPSTTSAPPRSTTTARPSSSRSSWKEKTLRGKLADAALPPSKTIEYAMQIASGLAAAHEKGVVHHDLKPENVFVTRDGLSGSTSLLICRRDESRPRHTR